MNPTDNIDNALLVIGSLHHDIMLDAPHLPRTGETVAGSRWHTKFGGKGGNQAVAAARSGAAVRMVSAVGQDAFAKPLLSALDAANVDRRWVTEIADIASGMSVAISDSQGDYGAVIVSGANLAIDAHLLSDEKLWEGVGMLCLQNEIDEAINIAAVEHAKQHSIPVCLNAAPARPLADSLISNIDVLVVNEIELAMISNLPVESIEQIMTAASNLAQRVPTVLVTLGERGVVVQTQDGSTQHIEAMKVDVVSTHGAGDVFIGQLCTCLLQDLDIGEAVSKANTTAGRHVAGLQD